MASAGCTERLVMKCLRETSLELKAHPQITANLVEYAGPQCYPQVAVEARYTANQRALAASTGDAPEASGMRRRGLLRLRCFFRCVNADCGKLRLVDKSSSDAVDPEVFAQHEDDPGFDWRAWLEGAQARHDIELKRNGGENGRRGSEGGGLEGCGEAEGQTESEADINLSGANCRLNVGSVAAPLLDVSSAHEVVASESDSEVRSSEECSDTVGRLAAVKASLGSRGGGLTESDKRALDELHSGAALRGRKRLPIRRAAFACSMLQIRCDDGTWRDCSCDEPCDYVSLRQRRSDLFGGQVSPGDVVALWCADDGGLAYDSPDRFERFGVITHVVLPGGVASGDGGGGDDGVAVTRNSARATEESNSMKVPKVVFKVLADDRGSAIPEVHAESATGVVFDVQGKPWSMQR